MNEKTFGQIAYEAAAKATNCDQPWELANQRKWNAAGNAVAEFCGKFADETKADLDAVLAVATSLRDEDDEKDAP